MIYLSGDMTPTLWLGDMFRTPDVLLFDYSRSRATPRGVFRCLSVLNYA